MAQVPLLKPPVDLGGGWREYRHLGVKSEALRARRHFQGPIFVLPKGPQLSLISQTTSKGTPCNCTPPSHQTLSLTDPAGTLGGMWSCLGLPDTSHLPRQAPTAPAGGSNALLRIKCSQKRTEPPSPWPLTSIKAHVREQPPPPTRLRSSQDDLRQTLQAVGSPDPQQPRELTRM